MTFAESTAEQAALAWLESLDHSVLHGPDIASGEPAVERKQPELPRRGAGLLSASGPRAPQYLREKGAKSSSLDAPCNRLFA